MNSLTFLTLSALVVASIADPTLSRADYICAETGSGHHKLVAQTFLNAQGKFTEYTVMSEDGGTPVKILFSSVNAVCGRAGCPEPTPSPAAANPSAKPGFASMTIGDSQLDFNCN